MISFSWLHLWNCGRQQKLTASYTIDTYITFAYKTSANRAFPFRIGMTFNELNTTSPSQCTSQMSTDEVITVAAAKYTTSMSNDWTNVSIPILKLVHRRSSLLKRARGFVITHFNPQINSEFWISGLGLAQCASENIEMATNKDADDVNTNTTAAGGNGYGCAPNILDGSPCDPAVLAATCSGPKFVTCVPGIRIFYYSILFVGGRRCLATELIFAMSKTSRYITRWYNSIRMDARDMQYRYDM